MEIVRDFKKRLDSLDNHVDALSVEEIITNHGYITQAEYNPMRLYVTGKKEPNRANGVVIEFDYDYREASGKVTFHTDIDPEIEQKIGKIMEDLLNNPY